MNFEKQYRNSKILFGLSLVLLVGFLAAWLQNVYQDKVDEVENKVSYLWIKSIKDVEGKDFTKIIFTAIASGSDSMAFDTAFTGASTIKKKIFEHFQPNNTQHSFKALDKREEEVKVVLGTDSVTFTGRSSQMLFLDSNIAIDIRGEIDTQFQKEAFVEFSSDKERKFLNIMAELSLDIALVESKLDSELVQSSIPIHYKINKIKADSILKNIPDKFRTKTANGEQYSLLVTDYHNFVLQKMWFEFLMSLLLLAIISAAFYYSLYHLKEQNKLVHLKNDFISNITHELRTPIFTVSAALEALQNFNGLSNPARTKEYLDISQNELNRLSILVEKVLKTSLFEQSVIQINKENLPINNLIQGVVNSWQLQLEKQGASLTIESSNENMQVYADKIHLTNVVYNLIDNALKYSSDTPPVIKINLKEVENAVQISISDNGIGIPKEYLNQVFDKFFRVPKGNEHSVKGYGLGLNYVAGIVKQHGGTISVKSQEGLGTEFLITLPKNTVK